MVGGHVDPEEPFVVPQVEVDLPAVFEDVHLAVLVGVHRPRVHVEVRVDLHRGHVEARVREQSPGGGGGDPLPQPGHHPAGDEDELPTE